MRKCFCFAPTCNNNWSLLIIFLLYVLLIGLSFIDGEVAVINNLFMSVITVLAGYYLWNVAPSLIGRSFYGVVIFQIFFQFLLSGGTGTGTRCVKTCWMSADLMNAGKRSVSCACRLSICRQMNSSWRSASMASSSMRSPRGRSC